MKVLAKIDDSKYVVEIEESECKYQVNDKIIVNHDYVNVIGSTYVGGKERIYPRVSIHLSIREMIQLVLPYLQEHPYMQKEHLIHHNDNGEPYDAYAYCTGDVTLCGPEICERKDDGLHCKRTNKHYFRKDKVYHVTETTKEYVLQNKSENEITETDLPDVVNKYDIDMHEL